MRKSVTAVLLAGIFLLAMFLRLYGNGTFLTGDEAQVSLAIQNTHPVIGYKVMNFFVQDLGIHPRVIQAILNSACVFLLFYIGMMVRGVQSGLVMAFLFSIFPASLVTARDVHLDVLLFLFELIAVVLFMQIEFRKKDSYAVYLAFAFFLYLANMVKIQGFLAFIPGLLLYGVLMHRRKVFSMPVYWIIAFSMVPFFLHLAVHPELLINVLSAYTESTIGIPFSVKSAWALGNCLLIGGVLSFFMFFELGSRFSRLRRNEHGRLILFSVCMFLSSLLLVIGADVVAVRNYLMLALPFLVAAVIFLGRLSSVYRYLLIGAASLLFVLVIYLPIPFYGFVHGSYGYTVGDAQTLAEQKGNLESVKGVLQGEDAVIFAGSGGYNYYYYLGKRIYLSSVINSDKLADIDYALLIHPLEKNHLGNPHWDSYYINTILENSDLVLSGDVLLDADRGFSLVKLNNKDIVLNQTGASGKGWSALLGRDSLTS